jgi:hypothetical protein
MKRSSFLTTIGWVLLISSWFMTKGGPANILLAISSLMCFTTAIGMQIGDKKGSENERSLR